MFDLILGLSPLGVGILMVVGIFGFLALILLAEGGDGDE